jgi:hypothetical protein
MRSESPSRRMRPAGPVENNLGRIGADRAVSHQQSCDPDDGGGTYHDPAEFHVQTPILCGDENRLHEEHHEPGEDNLSLYLDEESAADLYVDIFRG